MDHPLISLLEQMRYLNTEGQKSGETIQHIELNVASYTPPISYQANVKMKDATLAWGTSVSEDPVEALQQALYISLRGDEARKTESKAVFHLTREKAKAVGELLEMEHGESIAAVKIELEPYKGWVVVLFPAPRADLSHLLPMVEIRSMQGAASPAKPAPRSATPKTPAGPKVASVSSSEGGRASQTKDKLEAEYKSIYGKGPDRNIKKLDLAKLLDDLESASSGAKALTEETTDDEDDLL